MIESYLAASRLSQPANGLLSDEYYKIYDALTELLGDEVKKPEFFVTYSMNRICENVSFGDKKYIVYDQYMGQSISQLNRILFFGEEPDDLTMAYAFKVQAEEAFIRSNFKRALFFAMCYKKIYDETGDRRYSANRLSSSERLLLGICQECFVIAHELAHEATGSPLFNSQLICDEWDDIQQYLDKIITDSKPFSDDLMSPTHRVLHDTYRKKSEEHSLNDRRDVYKKILERIGKSIVPEVVSDRLACELTLKVTIEQRQISPFLANLGILLAIRYMRIFQYLRNAATFLREAEPWLPNEPSAVKDVEQNMIHYLMEGPTGLQSLAAWQVREKMLRRQLFQSLGGLGHKELSRIDKEAQKLIFFFEENMDDEISYFLPFNIARGAPLYQESQFDIEISEARKGAALLLGWV